MRKKTIQKNIQLFNRVKELLSYARAYIAHNTNHAIVRTYFEIGKMIVVEEQQGKERAEYGKGLLIELSKGLTKEFGKGYTVRNLELMRMFYLTYLPKSKSVISKSSRTEFTLSWTHYILLMRIEDKSERQFYEIEAKENNWSVRELQRQIDSALYERLALSRNKKKVKELGSKGHVITKPEDLFKEPYVLEFLGLKESASYSESRLESAIIEKLEHFLLELGKGFTFVARQQRIAFDESRFYVDLVFYNRLLRCFVLIDLKIGELKHQDLGQMQMYVNFYDREIKLSDENNTIGLILCKDKKDAIVEYTLPNDNNQVFARKYKTILPSKKKLQLLLR